VRLANLVSASCISLVLGAPAWANMVITPTFAANILSDPNSATIQATINAAIAVYESDLKDTINVNITFQEGGGLGSSSTLFFTTTYAAYLANLTAHSKTNDDATALAHLPDAAGYLAFFGTSMINVKTANDRAIGVANVQAADGTITLNTSIMNLSRTGPQDPAKYDLMAVASHEIDEVLGLGSGLPSSANPFPEDLFRYDSSHARSYNTVNTTTAFFSIDGTTNLVQFHQQNGDGGDYGDWQNGGAVKVQDWQGTAGSQPNLGVELRALDVIGYDSIAPEPGTGVLLAAALIVLAGLNYARVSRKPRCH
jgi:hypothetical protein